MRSKRHLLLALAALSFLFATAPVGSAGTLKTETSLLQAVNQIRVEHGLQPLRVDATLERAARAHTLAMLRDGRFAHGAFSARLRAFGVDRPRIGENLAWAAGSDAEADAVVRAWLASPKHRANLLQPDFTQIGIGAVRGTFEGRGGALVVTADFGGF